MITGTTTEMEYKQALAADSTYIDCQSPNTTALTVGSYAVRYKAKTGHYAGAAATITVPAFVKSNQNAPDKLTTAPPSSSTASNGKIIGTTTAMEYKLDSAADNLYVECSNNETYVAGGTYVVRYKATSASNASPTTTVTVTAPAPKHIATLERLYIDFSLDGSPAMYTLPGFSEAVFDYDEVIQESNADDSFVLGGTATSGSNATVGTATFTLGSDYKSTASITVTSEDGQVTNTYSVNLFVQRKSLEVVTDQCTGLTQAQGNPDSEGTVVSLNLINGNGDPCTITEYGTPTVFVSKGSYNVTLTPAQFSVNDSNNTITLLPDYLKDLEVGSYFISVTIDDVSGKWHAFPKPSLIIQ
jgi:hypothetical protein